MYAGTRHQGTSPRVAKATVTAGLRWLPLSLPRNRMTAKTVTPIIAGTIPGAIDPEYRVETTPPRGGRPVKASHTSASSRLGGADHYHALVWLAQE
ncbi:MAG: hypothetical protein RLZ55_1036, partial [Actinomycetota bacterium]